MRRAERAQDCTESTALLKAVATRLRNFAERLSPRPPAEPAQQYRAQHGQADVEAQYDAAQDTRSFGGYWASADYFDADSAHSKEVRAKLVSRSRYETANNPFADGIAATYCNDLIASGPKLRMMTSNPGFNQTVEAVFARWASAVNLREKLWCMAHAKHQDGEGFGICVTNPSVAHTVKVDIQLIEAEQCQTPDLPFSEPGYLDGIKTDEFGNAEWYDILPHHPGGRFAFDQEPDQVPAAYVLHYFRMRRPGQYRGIPETTSSLNTGAAMRRWKEATVLAAETAAKQALVMQTTLLPKDGEDGAYPVDPFDTIKLDKNSLTALPKGWELGQVDAKHPNSQYATLSRALINEMARPKNMPYNVASCDSSSYNFASGRLDYLLYHASLDSDRWCCEERVLNKVFAIWWAEATAVYGWNAYGVPSFGFDWPKHAVVDRKGDADADAQELKLGTLSLTRLYARNGEDYADVLPELARDYGMTDDEMRKTLRQAIFNASNQQASMALAEQQAKKAAAEAVQIATETGIAPESAETGDTEEGASE